MKGQMKCKKKKKNHQEVKLRNRSQHAMEKQLGQGLETVNSPGANRINSRVLTTENREISLAQ
jgi:hypothetical protein